MKTKEGRYKATLKNGFNTPLRKASLLKSSRWSSGLGPVGCQSRTLSPHKSSSKAVPADHARTRHSQGVLSIALDADETRVEERSDHWRWVPQRRRDLTHTNHGLHDSGLGRLNCSECT